MSRFLSSRHSSLKAYTPGEQPKDRQYIKLNTNESPFPPSPIALRLARQAAGSLNLYSDPEAKALNQIAADYFKVSPDEILFTNGSDEILNFAFMAFADENSPAVFPDVTYGFYPVFAKLNGIPYQEIPLKEDFSIDVNDYLGINKTIFIANPNAQTGIALPLFDIEKIVASNPSNIVVIDEAYVDFGAESAVGLIHKYNNLLVTQTLSKSRSLAGARLGFGIASKELIADLNTIKYSTNPYNVNRMTMAAGIGAISDDLYFRTNCEKIIKTREAVKKELAALGFTFADSKANFVLAKSNNVDGKELYLKLKEKGVLVRHFDDERLKDYNRITIGSDDEMATLIEKIKEISEV